MKATAASRLYRDIAEEGKHGTTLRENMGLERPKSRYVSN
jgi:hypothetical protein